MSVYVTVSCPRCMSTSHLPAASLTVDGFLCPVCSEGEIRSGFGFRMVGWGDFKIPFDWKDLAVICRAPR
jgi:hypothetical protein